MWRESERVVVGFQLRDEVGAAARDAEHTGVEHPLVDGVEVPPAVVPVRFVLAWRVDDRHVAFARSTSEQLQRFDDGVLFDRLPDLVPDDALRFQEVDLGPVISTAVPSVSISTSLMVTAVTSQVTYRNLLPESGLTLSERRGDGITAE